ncbi:MAG: pyridoxal phosphate-dependent aminotransferase [Gammaproteobacteria bacterium]|nr:pyridoxal phosphate-dependent aminotransferase [Gammaproteobacteria bacterium]
MSTDNKLPFSRIANLLAAPSKDVWHIHYEALKRIERGEEITLLSVGDPDFNTPVDITQHLVERINAGRTHYSPPAGERVLREALAALECETARRLTTVQRHFSPEQFTIFPGVTSALYALLTCMLDPGDEIVVPDPMYLGYQDILTAVQAKPVSVPLDLTQDALLDVAHIEAALTPKTKVVLINTPGNPCGNIIPPETLKHLAEICRERNIWLICDEVYSLITFDSPHVSLLNSAENLDNIAVVDGLSKSHAMSGWRVGWVVSETKLSKALERFSAASLFGCSQFIQDGAAFALQTDMAHVEEMRVEYQKRRDYMINRLSGFDELGYIRPAGGMFIMVDASRITSDGTAFAEHLLAKAGISSIPGSGLGAATRSYVRLGLTQNVEVLSKAMDRLAAALPDICKALDNG